MQLRPRCLSRARCGKALVTCFARETSAPPPSFLVFAAPGP
ncbi:hypothetical protein JL2886_02134 [Phaeobacter gallaeciensis]|uniref:Uncharacterized protein n=1 Tax=Phaeobacter gallaeciensis TaxID=60890 RepID=A0A1B0ZS96_9RHOB|nr:hypothetical protein JL2886_02134 [Phaeobacter gallaeciensis]